jgi:hypothetical protein
MTVTNATIGEEGHGRGQALPRARGPYFGCVVSGVVALCGRMATGPREPEVGDWLGVADTRRAGRELDAATIADGLVCVEFRDVGAVGEGGRRRWSAVG